MKIIICGSISAADEIDQIKLKLEALDHKVEVPEGVKNPTLRARATAETSERAQDKIAHDLIRGYYEKIKLHDAVLIVNPPKKGIEGYIGGNTLMEMAFAHVLDKKLYCLYPLPEMPYTSELIAMQPAILNGDVAQIR